jgi:trehalose 6-phosphate phosphatase
MPRRELAERLRPLTRDPDRAAIFCDIDGVLAPIVERPEDASVPDGVARLMGELGRRYACVACVTGRRADQARRLVGEPSLVYAGLHGAELLEPGEERARLVPAVREWEGRARAFARARADESRRSLGIRVEDKGPIAALHWRGARDEDAARADLESVAAQARDEGLVTHWGRKVLEVRPPVPIDKGQAVRHLVVVARPRAALYAGDDATDLDAFDALDDLVSTGELRDAVRVGVRSDEGPRDVVARADLVVDGTPGFEAVLAWLLEHAGSR